MRSAHDNAACAAKRGWVRSGPPPLGALRRGAVVAAALLGCTMVGAACSSSGGASASTVGSTALKIPPPFEVGQQVGLGAVTITVDSFRRAGESISVRVDVANSGTGPLTIAPTDAFAVFYGSGLHAPTTATGLARPLAPNSHGTATLEFSVPTEFGFPLVWFRGSVPGTRAGTVVLRGNGS